MSDKKPKILTREERLAASLRENLRRRKAVARRKPIPKNTPDKS